MHQLPYYSLGTNYYFTINICIMCLSSTATSKSLLNWNTRAHMLMRVLCPSKSVQAIPRGQLLCSC